nr:helix-turn-helix transcriptional regulator [Clostridia bacterium]
MKNTIGMKIRELRKENKITQEQLASALNISFQAVSKWENNISLPDVTLIPAIAGYFGVTTDTLFDFNLSKIESEVEAICDEAYKYRESDPAKSRAILEDGLSEYPDNEILLNNLLYVISDPDESISAAMKLIEHTVQPDIKYDALRFLAYAYDKKGDKDNAAAAIEQIPEIYFTKLSEMAFVLDGKQKYEAADKQKWISFEMLIQMMWKLAEYYIDCGDTVSAVKETEKALRLIEIIDNKCFDNYVGFFERKLAEMRAESDGKPNGE